VAPVTITFDGTGSTDPSGESLSYSWDFDNGETSTTATATTTYTSPGAYLVTLIVTNTSGKTDIITKTITVTDGDVSCAFGTPFATSLPSINTSFENIFVLGNGGPNLDNVTKFEINWDVGNNGLYQLSMSTSDGSPNWWNDFLPKVTQNFNSSEPEITITDSGFSGLDGSYWATIDADNFVLVSKTGGFTIYFSTSTIAPNCNGGTTPTPVVNGGSISGGPFSFTIGDGMIDNVSGISLVGNTGTNSQWVVTDDQNNILGLPVTIESVDFDTAGTGTCLIWHLSYENDLQGLAMNANINALVGDFDFSNSISVFRNPASSGGGDCTFGTPLDSALPSINSAFENVFVLGDGGPDLSNIIKFEVNWDQASNGFYQFSMNTSNGIPNWWNDLLPKVTHSFDTPQPSILISASGIPGFDGDYWVGLDGSNFVLVSKSQGFSIYFSTSSISPDCTNATAAGMAETDVVISPNPAVNYIHVDISQDEFQKHSGVTQLQLRLYTLTGLTITTKFIEERKQNIQTVIPVDGLESGIYILEIIDYKTNTQIRKKIIIHR